MERCSPEICAEIFRLACRDDGTTGRSLSLVSTYIHDASSPFKYQSLAVRGPHQTVAFAAVLEHTPSAQRRVHDFSISIDFRHPSVTRKIYTDQNDLSMKTLTKMYHLIRSFVPGWREMIEKEVGKEEVSDPARQLENEVSHAFLRILELISPTLQSLSISFRDMKFPLFFSPLPYLRELSIAYVCCSGGRDPVSDCALSSLQHLPSLRRLNLRHFDPICTQRQLISHIARFAPEVTHLRMPIGYGSWQDGSAKNDPLWNGTEEPQLPHTLECILVQPCLATGYMSAEKWSFYKSGLERFRQLAIIDSRVTVLQPAMWERAKLSEADQIDPDWLDRMCWNTDSRLARIY